MIEQAKELLNKDAVNEDKLVSEINDLNSEINALSQVNDYSSDSYLKATKTLSLKQETLELTKKLKKTILNIEDLEKIQEGDELFDLVKEDLENSNKDLEISFKRLEELTAKPLPNDDKKAIFEIRPGVGGIEASLFAEQLYRMYTRYLSSNGKKVEIYGIDYDNDGGIKEATFIIDEPGSFGDSRFEAGVHRVQRVPSTEAAGRIHTSTASIVVLPQIEAKDVNIKPEDLKIDVYRASGPGGQSVNTTDSAVRITHIPTGIVVTCQNGKSQHKNKDMAMNVLISKLSKMDEEKRMSQERDIRNAAILGGDRSAKIRTYNFPQSRITDHRIGVSWFNIEEIVNGEIGEILSTVKRDIRAQLD